MFLDFFSLLEFIRRINRIDKINFYFEIRFFVNVIKAQSNLRFVKTLGD